MVKRILLQCSVTCNEICNMEMHIDPKDTWQYRHKPIRLKRVMIMQ